MGASYWVSTDQRRVPAVSLSGGAWASHTNESTLRRLVAESRLPPFPTSLSSRRVDRDVKRPLASLHGSLADLTRAARLFSRLTDLFTGWGEATVASLLLDPETSSPAVSYPSKGGEEDGGLAAIRCWLSTVVGKSNLPINYDCAVFKVEHLPWVTDKPWPWEAGSFYGLAILLVTMASGNIHNQPPA